MKTLQDFQLFYNQDLRPVLHALHLEAKALLKKEGKPIRQRPQLKKLKRRLFLFSIPIVFILLFTLPFVVPFYIATCYYILHIGGRMGLSELGAFRLRYKELVIRKIIDFFGYPLAYHPFESITKEQVNNCLIFPQFAQGLIGEDFVQGTIDKTTVTFSEIFALVNKDPQMVQLFASEEQKKKNKFKMETELNSLIAKSSNPFFRGLFFIADFHKDFDGTILVRPRNFEWGNKQLQQMEGASLSPSYKVAARLKEENTLSGNTQNLEEVHLEDPEFATLFKVYSNDQVLARYVLTTNMMERIKDFRAKTGNEVFLSFKNTTLNLAIPYEHSILEPKGIGKEHFIEYLTVGKSTQALLEEENADENHIYEFFNDLHFVFSIVDHFNLNTRIWTKRKLT
jgi:hypothetical protein